MSLTVADRRAIFTWARFDPEFRERLEAEPRKTVEAVIKRPVPDDSKIELVDETAAWSFVLVPPAMIDAELPEPFDYRSAIENDVYEVLRDDPTALKEATADPALFLRNRFDVTVDHVNVLNEPEGTLKIVLPSAGNEDELSDAALDRVNGGSGWGICGCGIPRSEHTAGAGNAGEQCGKAKNPYSNNPSPR